MSLGRTSATGRSAASRSYTIADLPGLAWWIEPDGIVAADATNIDSWTDKSGNGKTISETSANRPTVLASALDGFAGAKMVAASSQRLSRSNAPIITGKNFTAGLVMKVDALVTDSYFLTNAVQGTNGWSLVRNAVYSNILHAVAFQDANAISTTGYHTFIYQQSGYANGTFRYDRTQQSMAASLGFKIPGATAKLVIGADASNANHASITVIAGFICNANLSLAQVQFAENYWKAKYPSLT